MERGREIGKKGEGEEGRARESQKVENERQSD